MIGIFVLGANVIQVNKMFDYAREHYGSAERYEEESRLIDCARKNHFDKILVFDREALSTEATNMLNSMNVDIICWKEDGSLKKALEKKKELENSNKKTNEEKTKNLREIRQLFN
ncbi:MAG: hypothetical protein KJ906_00800 [Nanoarchaeota archaeon]|nr:hypothetical protein [Nanoarchaeota archaeon]